MLEIDEMNFHIMLLDQMQKQLIFVLINQEIGY